MLPFRNRTPPSVNDELRLKKIKRMQYVESKDFENRLQLSILRGVVKVGLQKRYNVHTFCTLPNHYINEFIGRPNSNFEQESYFGLNFFDQIFLDQISYLSA